jgi:hypothetical protein
MTEDKTLNWREGQPTGPDVDSLLKAFSLEQLKPGFNVTDEQVKQHLGRCDGNRYRTVYTAWKRRLLRDHGINLYREELKGFYVPSNAEVLSQASPRLMHIGRTSKKHIREIAAIKAENEQQRIEQEHQGGLMHAISRESKKARMNLLPPTAAPSFPQIAPPKSAKA